MAMKIRKLFPREPTNQSVGCLDFCDPTCPYNCYPDSDSYGFIPPFPAPPPPPTSSDNGNHISSPYVIIIVTLLSSLFLLLSYYVIMVKYCSAWNPFRRQRAPRDHRNEEFLDENHGPAAAIDHHIWYIATVGLNPSVINSITVFKYKKGEGLVEDTVCSVCLNEFRDDETLRLLPKCNHAFHVPCIDTWLRSHTNCPMCRARILSTAANSNPRSNDRISNDLGRNQDTHMENSENRGITNNNPIRAGGNCENRAGTEDEHELDLPHAGEEITGSDRNSKENSNSRGSFGFGVAGDFAYHSTTAVVDEIQPLRRSVSMDSPATAKIGEIVSNVGITESEGTSLNPGAKPSDSSPTINDDKHSRAYAHSSPAPLLPQTPVSMKRSFSYAPGKSFLSRHHHRIP